MDIPVSLVVVSTADGDEVAEGVDLSNDSSANLEGDGAHTIIVEKRHQNKLCRSVKFLCH